METLRQDNFSRGGGGRPDPIKPMRKMLKKKKGEVNRAPRRRRRKKTTIMRKERMAMATQGPPTPALKGYLR